MIPSDPQSPASDQGEAFPISNLQSPISSPPSPIPDLQPPTPREPFWDYGDLLMFVLLLIGSLAVSLLLSAAFRKFSVPIRLLLAQILWYVLAFSALKALLLFRYDRPFWQSLGWRPIGFASAAGAFLAGPLMALSVGLLGSALRTPEINLPFEEMLGSTGTKVLLGTLVVILGPVAEELAFRGFLMPLLIRSLGAAGGIVLTGVIFGSVHGYEYQWSWQYMLLISLVGCILGWVKYRTQSTIASALMHSTFNLTQFVAFLAQQRSL
jgi:membrane protease YdiL (CAAX protease family)